MIRNSNKVMMRPDVMIHTPDAIEAKYPDTVKSGKKPKLGTGQRFAQLTAKLSKKGVKNPKALAAFLGRKKFGKVKFQKLAKNG